MALSEIIGGFSGFKARMLLFAGVVVLAGSVWTNGREMQRSGQVFRAPSSPTGGNWTTGGTSAERDFFLKKGDAWSKGAVSLGISFMAAMIAGSILRAAFKTGLTLLILGGVAVWFLERQGYVTLWDEYFATVREGGDWLTTRAQAVAGFVQAHLPSAGAALVGFGFGLKR